MARGWEKENYKNILGRKYVDKSILKYGTVIPIKLIKEFYENISDGNIELGTSKGIDIIVDGKKYKGKIENVNRRSVKSDTVRIIYSGNNDLLEYLNDKFKYTADLLNHNEKVDTEEYIDFYKGENLNEFIFKLHTYKDSDPIKQNTNKEITEKSHKELIDYISNYIKSQGYEYDRDLISNLYLSLKTKPFVILAGISGTGKSKIVRLFAEALGATEDNYQYNMISVRPDWNDNTDLIGYKNLEDKFIKGKLTQIIDLASVNLDKPYFVCLDEMNLARVEYYLSDYLSVIESRRKNGDRIITDSLICSEDIDSVEDLRLPENLYIIGTVNMDDTTFQFSRKVLDRANTIEFSDVNLANLFTDEGSVNDLVNRNEIDEDITDNLYNEEDIEIYNDFMKTNYLKTNDIEQEYRDYAKYINAKIIEINEILKQSQKQFAYRVRDEILFYMIENKKSMLLEEDVAFDYQIMQKILPTINGSENPIKVTLINLFNFVYGKDVINDIEMEEIEAYLTEDALRENNVKYVKSAKKIAYMLRGYEYDGYTSYWY